jgi:hypothetical protein
MVKCLADCMSTAVGKGRWLGCCGSLFEISGSGECLCDFFLSLLD